MVEYHKHMVTEGRNKRELTAQLCLYKVCNKLLSAFRSQDGGAFEKAEAVRRDLELGMQRLLGADNILFLGVVGG